MKSTITISLLCVYLSLILVIDPTISLGQVHLSHGELLSPVAEKARSETGININPATGQPGTVVTVSGTEFTRQFRIRFQYPDKGWVLPVQTRFVSPSQLQFTVPSVRTLWSFCREREKARQILSSGEREQYCDFFGG
jgi:hypothetical protein